MLCLFVNSWDGLCSFSFLTMRSTSDPNNCKFQPIFSFIIFSCFRSFFISFNLFSMMSISFDVSSYWWHKIFLSLSVTMLIASSHALWGSRNVNGMSVVCDIPKFFFSVLFSSSHCIAEKCVNSIFAPGHPLAIRIISTFSHWWNIWTIEGHAGVTILIGTVQLWHIAATHIQWPQRDLLNRFVTKDSYDFIFFDQLINYFPIKYVWSLQHVEGSLPSCNWLASVCCLR